MADRRNRAVRTVLAAALLAVLACVAVPAAAGAEPEGAPVPTMVVLDGSGSMSGPDPAGGTKIAAARTAVHAMLGSVPDGAPVGLAVYGTGTGNTAAERDRGCQDVSVVRPPAAVDRDALGQAVDAVTPRGYTPIGHALQVAAAQLPSAGPRSIVLVSDGEDTCAPPQPCEVARTLAGQGVDLVVHAVGFGVDDAARAQLSCLAQATGGTYTDALDGPALARILPRLTATALRSYAPVGAPIAGGADAASAPVTDAGQHLDTLGQQETRYYAVDVPSGATAYLSATMAYPRVPGISETSDFNALALRTYGHDGTDCHRFVAQQAIRSSDGVPLTVATAWSGAAQDGTGPCAGGGRYVFSVEWNRVSAGVPSRLPLELLVGIEPGVRDAGPLPAAPPLSAPVDGPAAGVAGGGSFATAAPLAGTGVYTDTVQRGEYVYYRVRLGWGQSLAYRVRFDAAPSRGVDDLSVIRAAVYAPTRDEIGNALSSYDGSARQLPFDGSMAATAPVRYRNRESRQVAVRAATVPGWYYVGVAVSPPRVEDSPTAGPVPVRLEVRVDGAAEPGPTYTDALTSPFDPPAAAPAAAAAADSAGTSSALPVALGVGACALVGVGGLAAVLLRRRRRSR